MTPLLLESVTWIKVEKPVFDLVGVVLNSLGLAAICAGIALALGTALGLAFIARRRREQESFAEAISLHLDARA
jgi:ABC-type spermidine/putrescine transport system permease subunit II